MIIIVLISCQDTFGQQNVIIDDKGIGDNLTLIISAILFVIGFIALIILKKREEHKIENEHKTNHLSKHIHHHLAISPAVEVGRMILSLILLFDYYFYLFNEIIIQIVNYIYLFYLQLINYSQLINIHK